MIKKLGLCMLLFVCIAAFEMYDDNHIYGMEPDGEDDYNAENYDYQDVGPYRPQTHDDPVQSLMLYHLFNSLQNRDDARLRMPYRPKFKMMDNLLASYSPVAFSEMIGFKGAVAKRRLSAPGSVTAASTTSGQKSKPAIPGQDTNPIVKPLRKKREKFCGFNTSFPAPRTSDKYLWIDVTRSQLDTFV